MNSEPRVSVVIPVKNGQATLEACLKSIFAQTHKNIEVIVVNDGSTDRTAAIASQFATVKLVHLDGRGSSAAKNKGIEMANGEFVAFTDADCIVDTHWIEELLRGMDGEQVAGCGGSQHSPDQDTDFGRKVHEFFAAVGFVSEYYKGGTEIIDCHHNPTCNALLRRDVLIELGGFREELWPCEDLELDHRLEKSGFRLKYNPLAKVFHFRPQTFNQLMAMIRRYGAAHGDLVQVTGFYRRLHFLAVAAALLPLVFASIAVINWTMFVGLILLGIGGCFLRFLSRGVRLPRLPQYLWWSVASYAVFTLSFWRSLVMNKLGNVKCHRDPMKKSMS